MKIGPLYKKARRLGAFVFEKTQSQKYAIRAARTKGPEMRPPKSDFGVQMLEKQRMRFMYGVNERQFSKYVKEIIAASSQNQEDSLYQKLESRLDNVVLRGGFAHTRFLARQMVAHGHIIVNGKKVTIPSFMVSKGDIIRVREGSTKKVLFATLDEKLKAATVPSFLKLDLEKKQVVVQGKPTRPTGESLLNYSSVIQYYKR